MLLLLEYNYYTLLFGSFSFQQAKTTLFVNNTFTVHNVCKTHEILCLRHSRTKIFSTSGKCKILKNSLISQPLCWSFCQRQELQLTPGSPRSPGSQHTPCPGLETTAGPQPTGQQNPTIALWYWLLSQLSKNTGSVSHCLKHERH